MSGKLYCKGRTDHQIKLRGLRIELEEIEYKINTFKKDLNINSVIVLRKINNRDCLHAFLTCSSPINLEELKKYLLNNLPNYMVPTSYSIIDSFPKTPNGKIDKKALPEKIEFNTIINPPTTKTQITLCSILEKLLKIKINNIDENIFNLGADSLIAIGLITEIQTNFNKKISIKDIFENNTISLLSTLIENVEKNYEEIIKACPKQECYTISSEQKGIFYSSNATNLPVYNLTGAIEFFEEINILKIQKCFNTIVKRHEAFRTRFEFKDGEIVQKIEETVKINIEEINGHGKTKNQILNNFNTEFDLSKAPLLKVGIAKLEENHYLLLISTHHIIVDGTSFQILVNDFIKLYNNKKLEELELTYKDYANFERTTLLNNKNKEFWINKFENRQIKPLNLPTTYNRPSNFTYMGSKITKIISQTLTKNILDFCNKNELTPFMFMISIYFILLKKYSDNTDILIGTPVANREYSNVSNIIGMFVNTVIIDSKIEDEIHFIDFCNKIKNTSLEAFNHQNYPFNELVKNLNIKKDLSRNSIIDVLFTYQNTGISKLIPIKNTKYFIPNTKTSKFDISLEVLPNNDSMELNFEYCTSLFNKEFINDFSKHYIEIIKSVLKNSQIKIKDINMISKSESYEIIYGFNRTELKYQKSKTIHQLFEEQTLKNPNKIAAIFGETKLTYKEINQKINNLAYYLIQNNINKGDFIGILLNRSIEMLICMMAILKAGRNLYSN